MTKILKWFFDLLYALLKIYIQSDQTIFMSKRNEIVYIINIKKNIMNIINDFYPCIIKVGCGVKS